MKKIITLALLLLATSGASGKIIENPDYEISNTAVIKPTSVERTKDATRISFHARFRPNYWIKIDKDACLVDSAGNKYEPISLEGMNMGQEFWMPESGEHDFTIVYPPLPKNVNVVDFDEISWKIKGLRLDGKPAAKNPKIDFEKWEKEHHVAYSGTPDNFFNKGVAHLSGMIGGYSSKLGNDNITINCIDPLTGKLNPRNIPIKEDGSFSIDIPLSTPRLLDLYFDHKLFTVYLEPGRSLELAINWEDFLEKEIEQLMNFKTTDIRTAWGGELGDINREISMYSNPDINIFDISQYLVPDEALFEINANYEQKNKTLADYIKDNKPHSTTINVLRAIIDDSYLSSIFEYEMLRERLNSTDTVSQSKEGRIEISFFDGAKKIMASENDWLLIGNNMPIITNRMAFSKLPRMLGFTETYEFTILLNPLAYLKTLGVALTPEEEEKSRWIDSQMGIKQHLNYDELNEIIENYNLQLALDAAERNGLSEQMKKYLEDNKNSNNPLGYFNLAQDVVYNVEKYNEVLKNYLGTDKMPLIWQAVLSAQSCSYGGMDIDLYSRDEVFNNIEEINNNGILHPSVINAMKDFYDEAYAKKSFEIPDDDKGRIIRELIAPYSGKILLLDFWGTNCGPCRSDIESSKERRALNRDNADFKRIYITNDSDSPTDAYNKYKAENLEGEISYMISYSDFNKLQQLFNFSGIPHYVLIDRDGKVLDSDVNLFYLDNKLKKCGVTLKHTVKESNED